MQESDEKDHDNQAKEELVIGCSNAVIEPPAMVIKVIYTPVASAAMLRCLTDMSLAYITLVLII